MRNSGRKRGFVQQACNNCYAESSLMLSLTLSNTPMTSVCGIFYVCYLVKMILFPLKP